MMQKVMVFVRRKAGTTPESFRAHYEGTHAPLVQANMTGLVRYVRNYPQAKPGEVAPPYDCVTELWFESAEALAASMIRIRNEEGKIIDADMDVFMDRTSMMSLPVDEMAS